MMESVIKVAAYISQKYKKEYKEDIDEMKLHKIMYFIQRESIVEMNQPIFKASFYGWKYGPILKEIRKEYKENNKFAPNLNKDDDKIKEQYLVIIEKTFEDYAKKDSWSLSRITHGEICWKNSRKGVKDSDNSDKKIKLKDIELDAERIKKRREALKNIGLI